MIKIHVNFLSVFHIQSIQKFLAGKIKMNRNFQLLYFLIKIFGKTIIKLNPKFLVHRQHQFLIILFHVRIVSNQVVAQIVLVKTFFHHRKMIDSRDNRDFRKLFRSQNFIQFFRHQIGRRFLILQPDFFFQNLFGLRNLPLQAIFRKK